VDPALTAVTWSNAATGGSGTATGTANWSASIPLAIGLNAITVTATDGAGNPATDVITVTMDQTLPAVTITGRRPRRRTSRWATVNLGGSTSDNVGVAGVTWSNAGTGGSGAADPPPFDSWTLPGIALARERTPSR